MKDLYTFDGTEIEALKTYESVKKAYSAFFDSLKLRYLVAQATSGIIGGNKNHEYHLLSSKGEDEVISCDNCGYSANEEIAKRDDGFPSQIMNVPLDQMRSWAQTVEPTGPHRLPIRRFYYMTKGCDYLIQVILPVRESNYEGTVPNTHVLKELYPSIDFNTANPELQFSSLVTQLSMINLAVETPSIVCVLDRKVSCNEFTPEYVAVNGKSYRAKVVRPGRDLVKIADGDRCPNENCQGKLKVQKCVELGHTFHLGTRYSSPLGATISGPAANAPVTGGQTEPGAQIRPIVSDHNNSRLPIQMGCHGIGISRLIAAAAGVLKDDKGLNWPRAMAPFEAVIVPTLGRESEASEVYDLLSDGNGTGSTTDCIIDDRPANFGAKMNDADLIGYPIIVVVGKGWERGVCQVQCRRLGSFKADVPLEELRAKVGKLLDQL